MRMGKSGGNRLFHKERLAWEGQRTPGTVLTLMTRHLPFSPSASPRPGKLYKASFLWEAHLSRAGSSQWPHNCSYQSRSQAQRPSTHQVSHVSCFHPQGQGWAQNSHILPGA